MKDKNHTIIVTGLFLSALFLGMVTGGAIFHKRRIPFVRDEAVWSIGVYSGDSPLHALPAQGVVNPVLTWRQVTDVSAGFVADPFVIRRDNVWHMFFEVYNRATGRGVISHATSSDGLAWTYDRVVLDKPFHVSYPFVFEWEDRFYMIPEAEATGSVRLYCATDFPHEWDFVAELLTGRPFSDSTILRHNDRWWLFTETDPYGFGTLRLYSADALLGPWHEHPESPIVYDDDTAARPAGRPVTIDGQLYRFAQNAYPRYGSEVRAFEILTMSEDEYVERIVTPDPVLQANPDTVWNKGGMHHLCAVAADDGGMWLAFVDGRGPERRYDFGGLRERKARIGQVVRRMLLSGDRLLTERK